MVIHKFLNLHQWEETKRKVIDRRSGTSKAHDDVDRLHPYDVRKLYAYDLVYLQCNVCGETKTQRAPLEHASTQLTKARFFSRLSNKYPLLTRVGSSLGIVTMWFLFVPTLFYFAGSQQFSLAAYIAFALLAAVFALLTVGLLEFILEGWGMLQTGLGFIVTLIFLYILYLAAEFSPHH